MAKEKLMTIPQFADLHNMDKASIYRKLKFKLDENGDTVPNEKGIIDIHSTNEKGHWLIDASKYKPEDIIIRKRKKRQIPFGA